MTQPTPPGWYQDPNGPPGAFRWWDGVNWTASTQPQATAGGPVGAAQYGQGQYATAPTAPIGGQYGVPQPPKRRNTGLIVGVICAVVIVACGATIAIVLAGKGGGNDDKANPKPSNAASVKMVGLENDRATGMTYQRPDGWQDDAKDTDGDEVGAEMLWGQYICPNGKTCYAGVVYSGKATAGSATDLTSIVRDKLSDLVALRIGFGTGVKVSSSNDDIDGHKAYTETQDFKPSDQQATPGTLRVAAIDLGNGTVAYVAASVNTQVHAPPAGTLDAVFKSVKTNT
ncbi:MAG: DUF2510 domain-containing protein [Mycobacteriales bacterium]